MRILVAYNGSNAAKRALTAAQRRVRALSGELIICGSAEGADMQEGAEATLKNNLREAEMLCQACGISCKTHLASGEKTAAEDIIAYANKEGVEEIVVGIKRRSQLGKMLFGSTARMLIMEAPCPVLTVK
jgi:nucleotide-binding universal stress UspA family protein